MLLGCAAILAVPAAAQKGDDRVVTLPYRDGETVPLRIAAGNGLTIIFAPDERVLGFDVADPDAVEVNMWGGADSLFVKSLRPPSDPRLTVRTQFRNYVFSVETGTPEAAAYVVRFSYDGNAKGKGNSWYPASAAPRYRISGEKALRPSRISDDGEKTYLEWGPEQALPAVFAVNPFGDEEIVDGYMRNGIYTIDRVHSVLVFRIDKKLAKAERLTE